jgi:hypothetical protein
MSGFLYVIIIKTETVVHIRTSPDISISKWFSRYPHPLGGFIFTKIKIHGMVYLLSLDL